jgi:hypothetical protein
MNNFITLNFFNNFLTYYPYIIIYFIIIFLVLTDNRFIFNRKIIFIILNLLFFILCFYIQKSPYYIIKDLF